MNDKLNEKKRFRVWYFLNLNPNECYRQVTTLSEDFAIEDTRQHLIALYGRHGFKITRAEKLDSLDTSKT